MTKQGTRSQRAHHIHKRSEQAEGADKARQEDLMTSGRIVSEVQNSSDIGWLESMLARPELVILEKERPHVIERIKNSIAWLREVKSRTLGGHDGGYRKEYGRLWTTLQMIKFGKHKSPTLEQKQVAYSKYLLKKMRYEETKTVRPAWMNDPSLLPKRPPAPVSSGAMEASKRTPTKSGEGL
jgi:hypothetical protein